MTRHRLIVGCALALALSLPALADGLKSGPQVGEKLAGPFHPLNINGDSAGKKACLYCSNGDRAVAMIFARETSPALTKLIKKLEESCAKSKDELGSFVVFLGEEESLEGKLKKMASDCDLKEVILSIDNPAGPKGYNVSEDSDVTVVLYRNFKVKANHAFKKGEFTEKCVDAVLKDVATLRE